VKETGFSEENWNYKGESIDIMIGLCGEFKKYVKEYCKANK